jgi:hypothetical protein
MNTILASIMKMFEDCAKRLPDKRNIDHLELFSRDFYFRALRSLVVLSFPQLLSFSAVHSGQTCGATSCGAASRGLVERGRMGQDETAFCCT